MNAPKSQPFSLQGINLQLRRVSPGEEIHRIYRFPGGGFSPAPAQYRSGRLDPPIGRSTDYGMLYAADSLMTAALECGAVLVMPTSPPTYEKSSFSDAVLPPLRHVILKAHRQMEFVDFTHSGTTKALGLNLDSVLDDIRAWREASARVFDLLGECRVDAEIAGIFYLSKRNPEAFNYALFQGRYEYVFTAEEKGLLELK